MQWCPEVAWWCVVDREAKRNEVFQDCGLAPENGVADHATPMLHPSVNIRLLCNQELEYVEMAALDRHGKGGFG